jgi:hypothetical protein
LDVSENWQRRCTPQGAKAFLLTFVAGQKYGVGRDVTRRFCSFKKAQGQLVVQMLP